MPNEIPAEGELHEMCCVNVFNLKSDDDGKTIEVTFANGTGSTSSVESLEAMELNTNGNGARKLAHGTAEVLATHLRVGEITDKIKSNAYLIDFHDIRKRLNERSVYIDDETRQIEDDTLHW